MNQNSRRHLRKVPDEFAFIQIERDEVGRILNISEGGLSFCSPTPVPRDMPLYFWLSFNLRDRIEAMGEVTWTDFSKKIGGLRFLQLSQNGREQIRRWLSRLRTEEEISREEREEPVREFALASEPMRVAANGTDRVARFVAKARSHNRPFPVDTGDRRQPGVFSPAAALDRSPLDRSPLPPISMERVDRGNADNLARTPARHLSGFPVPSLEAGRGNSTAPAPAPTKPRSRYLSLSLEDGDRANPGSLSSSFAGMASSVELVPFARHLSAKKRQLLCGVLLGIGLSAAVAVPTLKYWNHRQIPLNAEPVRVEPAPAKNNVPAMPSTPQPAPAVTSPAFDPFSPGTASTSARRKQVASSYSNVPSPSQTLGSGASKQAAPTSFRPQWSTPSTASKTSMTPKQLWGAVQAGNSKAAVELAELYIKGEGVPRNCQQARVLLLVASEKRNAAAIKRLQELDKDPVSCP